VLAGRLGEVLGDDVETRVSDVTTDPWTMRL
jgi:hypothetical protein